jgi:transcriptional regulator with XRE-family HTH domain
MNAGPLLLSARRKAGLSQRELGQRAGVPQSTIARIESSVIDPGFRTLSNLLQACGYRVRLSKLGEGVDRTVMRELLKLTPAERVHIAAKEANNLDRLLASVRR